MSLSQRWIICSFVFAVVYTTTTTTTTTLIYLCLIATDYHNWLLYYSLPCLKGILDEEYHQHYALLVGAITFLSGRSISPEQLEIARKFLMHFVEMYDAHYG
mgnify:CR=1 FL=1